jgi:integrase
MLIEIAGTLQVSKLSTVQTDYINTWLNRYTNQVSKHRRAGAARTLFRRLWEDYKAPKLHHHIVTVYKPKPRNVTAADWERDAIMAAAPMHLRCWLVMCSDLAIRSGTAAKLGPEHYDSGTKELVFRTKYDNAQRLPTTAALRELIGWCTGDGPFVQQLAGGKKAAYKNLIDDYAKLKKKLGITRKLTPHDLRRTTARKVYKLTGDLREAQHLLGHADLATTAWYLQDSTVEVSGSTLELVKLNSTQETIQ